MQGGIHPDFTGEYQSMSCVGNVQLCNHLSSSAPAVLHGSEYVVERCEGAAQIDAER